MNETIRCLVTRRSIRAFESRQIPEEALKEIVEAGRYAATGMGWQPWHFTVVQDSSLLNWIVQENAKAMAASGNERMMARAKDPNFHNFHHAPISGSEGPLTTADCANATQNMAVAAHSWGLGSCYIVSFLTAFKGDRLGELAQRLQLPVGFTPMYSLAIGYAAGPAPAPAPRKENVTYIR